MMQANYRSSQGNICVVKATIGFGSLIDTENLGSTSAAVVDVTKKSRGGT